MAVGIVKLASVVVGIFKVTSVRMNSDSKLNAKWGAGMFQLTTVAVRIFQVT